MIIFCSYHDKEHESFEWKSFFEEGKLYWICRDAYKEPVKSDSEPFHIGVSKTDARVSHWGEIKKRVRTHEGELLNGERGSDYRKKYSKQYLGVDLSVPTDFSRPEYQKELRK